MAYRKIKLDIDRNYSEMEIGVTGENLATRIIVNCKAVLLRHPHARATMLIRHEKTLAYPAAIALVPDDASNVCYDIRKRDTSKPGRLYLEVQMIEKNVLIKSVIYKFRVNPGIGGVSDTPPDDAENWADKMVEMMNMVVVGIEDLTRMMDLLKNIDVKIVTLQPGTDPYFEWSIVEGVLVATFGIPTANTEEMDLAKELVESLIGDHNINPDAHRNMIIDGGEI